MTLYDRLVEDGFNHNEAMEIMIRVALGASIDSAIQALFLDRG